MVNIEVEIGFGYSIEGEEETNEDWNDWADTDFLLWNHIDYMHSIKDLEKAREKAKRLFLSSLTNTQRQSYDDSSQIGVTGSKGGKYIIDCDGSASYNIRPYDDKKLCYCLRIPNGMIPVYDQYLAQKLIIEHDEERFLRMSNHFEVVADTRQRYSFNQIYKGLAE